MTNRTAVSTPPNRAKRTRKKRHHGPPRRKTGNNGLEVPRVFSTENVHPFDEIEWERREASITGDDGSIIFKQENVEVPTSWSVLATNVVASKYLYGEVGTAAREHSVKQLIHRVTRTIADWGYRDGYFASRKDAEIFYREITWLCVNQYGAFNSPVWFNCGLFQEYGAGTHSASGTYFYDREAEEVRRAANQYEYPQCSACFIQGVDDTMESIMALSRSEAMLFKYGSGTGTDLSTIRSAREKLSGGGTPSGPLSFLKVYDAIAGVVKSGGKTRRAAKMNTLKCWHPDIKEFIEAKPSEERKAGALIDSGYEADFNGEAYSSVCFQNENLSVRVTDAFMQAVMEDREWETHWVTDPRRAGPKYRARDLLKWIAQGTWTCGDPGLQYEDTIQRWHTCKHTAPINSSNPCSEYMFLDDSACNLASLNLMKFVSPDGVIDVERFKAAVDIFITAQEIIVDHASYPTAAIARNSHRFRPLGLGYANLGALIMSRGLPYDSPDGRAIAAAITAIMHLEAYAQSARMAARLGPFAGYAENRDSMLEVIERHREAVAGIDPACPGDLLEAATAAGEEALAIGREHGYRNAQVTVLAPTGTIGFLMDCDTTGVEPDIALVKYKVLAGGGLLKIVNRTVPMALKRLGYGSEDVGRIVQYIEEHDTIEGAPDLDDEHLPVFDCAFRPRNGTRYIAYVGHIRMMAAVQPFLSGAISKTVNMPKHATVDEIMETFLEGWRLGLKALAIYRDGCKRSQPVSTGRSGAANGASSRTTGGNGSKPTPLRRRLPNDRRSITHKFDVGGHEGYLTVGLYEDGKPGELFITMAKEGSTIGGLMDCFGIAISICLQYGVPLEALVHKFTHSRFEPSGFTKNPTIPMAKSLVDYIFRWLEQQFCEVDAEPHDRAQDESDPGAPANGNPDKVGDQFAHYMEDAPACDQCGSITVRNGTCYKCYNCGHSMGCS